MENAHLAALETRHASLEALIDEEHHRPNPDELTLAQLKKKKLRLKDTIEGVI